MKWVGGGHFKTFKISKTSWARLSVEVQAAGTLVEVEDAARSEMGIISVQRYVTREGEGLSGWAPPAGFGRKEAHPSVPCPGADLFVVLGISTVIRLRPCKWGKSTVGKPTRALSLVLDSIE